MEIGILRAEIYPYSNFKEKLSLTKKLRNKGKCEVIGNYVYCNYNRKQR